MSTADPARPDQAPDPGESKDGTERRYPPLEAGDEYLPGQAAWEAEIAALRSDLAQVSDRATGAEAERDRLRARTHEIQAQEMTKRAALDSELAEWHAKWRYAEAETKTLVTDWTQLPTYSWWRMTSYANRAVILRLVGERNNAVAERDRLRAERDDFERRLVRATTDQSPATMPCTQSNWEREPDAGQQALEFARRAVAANRGVDLDVLRALMVEVVRLQSENDGLRRRLVADELSREGQETRLDPAPAERPDTQSTPSDSKSSTRRPHDAPVQGAGDTPDRERRAGDCGHVQHENWQGGTERVGRIERGPDGISHWERCAADTTGKCENCGQQSRSTVADHGLSMDERQTYALGHPANDPRDVLRPELSSDTPTAGGDLIRSILAVDR